MTAESTSIAIAAVTIALACSACGDDRPTAEPTDPQRVAPETDRDTGARQRAAGLRYERFPNAVAAVEQILARTEPRVVGFGEFHQQRDTAAYVSTLERFSSSVLPAVAGRTSDLIVEAWVSEGNCGATEQAVVEEVEQISERPETTEDENLTLLKRAKQLGVRPHILEMSCEDYRRVHRGDAGVDYVAMLELVAQRLEHKGKAVLAERGNTAAGKLIALFCGAIHNDLAPGEDFAGFAFGKALGRAAAGKYVEIDLYVPEFVLASESARDEPWFPLIGQLASTEEAALIERGPGSYIVLFRKGVLASGAAPKGDGS
jgi:hypothetical protein